MTFGEDRVGITFDSSGSQKVDEIKRAVAALIDVCHAGADKTDDQEIERLWSLAMTHFEGAAMWAVKAATKTPSNEN